MILWEITYPILALSIDGFEYLITGDYRDDGRCYESS
jgi:hypothetical protein